MSMSLLYKTKRMKISEYKKLNANQQHKYLIDMLKQEYAIQELKCKTCAELLIFDMDGNITDDEMKKIRDVKIAKKKEKQLRKKMNP